MTMLTLLVLAACTGDDPKEPGAGDPGDPQKVLVVGWDGARPDCVQAANTPSLDRVVEMGGVSWDAATQLTHPTTSGPGWMSVMTGVAPDEHGVVFNGIYTEQDESWLTFVKRAHDEGLRTGVAVVWPEVATDIIEDDAQDDAFLSADDEVADWMATAVDNDDFDIHVVHLDSPDHAGHESGYALDIPEYMLAIEDADERMGRILDAVEAREGEDWLIAVTTDHGGVGNGHGPLNADNQTIWTAYGRLGDEGGWTLSNASHLDVHPTVLDFLQIPVDERGVAGISQLP